VSSEHTAKLRAAALAAAERGWYVFPLWPGGKTPAMHGARDCDTTGACAEGHLGWEDRATRNPNQIARYWANQPLNVGVACGPSNLVVLDLDTPGGDHAEAPCGVPHGADTLARRARDAQGDGWKLPDDTYAVVTPSSGIHLYYQAPAGVTLKNTSGAVGELVDSRAGGGYVVAAGSLRPQGAYRVVNDAPVAPLPQWLITPLSPPVYDTQQPAPTGAAPAWDRQVRAYLAKVAQRVIAAQPGHRHDVLLRAAVSLGRLVGGGDLADQLARDTLLQAAAALDGFPELEATRCIEDGLRWGQHRPRRLAG
jgi:hypothetical protein